MSSSMVYIGKPASISKSCIISFISQLFCFFFVFRCDFCSLRNFKNHILSVIRCPYPQLVIFK